METSLITCETYQRRLRDLCLRSGLEEFPTKRRDQLILLKSIANGFAAGQVYSEQAVNEIIKSWRNGADCFRVWDHVTLRRRLVDESFLDRASDGSSYRVNSDGPRELAFEPGIEQVVLTAVLAEGQREIEQRKAAYLQNHA